MNQKRFAACLFIAFIIFSYFWLDRPIAWFIHDYKISSLFSFCEYVSFSKPIARLFALFGLFYFLQRFIWGKPTKRDFAILYAALSVAIVGLIINDSLKCVFHRYWPQTWNDNNLSLISNNVYGFYIQYECSSINEAFPSGHTAASCAPLTVLWMYNRRLWPFCFLGVFLTAAGLLIMNYHFLSDIFAGGLIGYCVGYWTFKIGSDNPLQSTV